MVVRLSIPKDATVKVKTGQKVKFGDVFYDFSSSEVSRIAVDQVLSIKPKQIFKFVKVVVGDKLEKDDLIAEKKRLIGKTQVKAEYGGTVTKIDHETGGVTISTVSKDRSSVNAFFNGKIKDIDKKRNVVEIDIGKYNKYDARTTSDTGGKRADIETNNFFAISGDDIRDRIIFVHTVQSHIGSKAEALGASGIVYFEGDISSEIPSAKISKEEDYSALIKSSDAYVLFSTLDNKIFSKREGYS